MAGYPLFAVERIYQEMDGIIAFEVEDVVESGYWRLMTRHEGFSGSGYYLWDGPNYFGTGGIGVLAYRVNVTHPGDYTILVHNFHDFGNPSEENDVWVRVNTGRWFKNYNHAVSVWNWEANYENANSFPGWNYLAEGENLIELSGRSHGFRIDRVHAFLPSMVSIDAAKSLDWPLSEAVVSGEAFSARFAGRPNVAYPGKRVEFDTSLVTLPEGRTLQAVLWEFGDAGAQSRQPSTHYDYDFPGTYISRLTIQDDLGNTAEHAFPVTMEYGPGGTIGVHALEESDHYGGDRPYRILDENPQTRWSNDTPGGWIQFDLGGVVDVDGVSLALFRGDERVYTFDVLTSRDGADFTEALSGQKSSGTTEDFRNYSFDQHEARYVRVVNRGNSLNDFLQITRARVLGSYKRQAWWRDAILDGDWMRQDGFGHFALLNYPWAFHANYGWLYSTSISPSAVVMYNLLPESWCFFSMEGFPLLYDYSRQAWVYLMVNTGTHLIYDYNAGTWSILQ